VFAADESDEYATFEAFARRLVQVPKAELDEKRKLAEKRKASTS
jgi:hypothetical protein